MSKFVIGIDEAGRGPVFGPLVICAFACRNGLQEELKKKGVRDSKQVESVKREALARVLEKEPHAVVEISAKELTELMNKRVSLNEIEARFASLALQELVGKLGKENVVKIIVDSPDPVPKKFGFRIKKYFDEGIELISENKADVNHVEVSAASIIAKSAREKRIKEIKKLLEKDFGNGYTHDEKTQEFLKNNWRDEKVSEFVRHKWVTAKRLKTTQIALDKFL